MKLTIEFSYRYTGSDLEPSNDQTIEAYVIQNGKRGHPILANRKFTKLESARMEVQTRMRGHELTFLPFSEHRKTTVNDQHIQSSRDRYGMKGI